MIRSKRDYKYYLEADRVALRIAKGQRTLFREIWKFERLLRRVEYLLNCRPPFFFVRIALAKIRFRNLSIKLGIDIPPNVCGPGLSIAHRGTIVVNANSMIGANCRIHPCVVIGATGGSAQAPKIGNNVYIGPGAKIFGSIEIADGIAIGANAVVNKTFLEIGVTIAGIPAKKISDNSSDHHLVRATELMIVKEDQ
jgi:serine O-acetyltransferase